MEILVFNKHVKMRDWVRKMKYFRFFVVEKYLKLMGS